MSEENHRIWGAGVGGWGARKGRRLIYREKFWVDGGNQIWRNCYECEEEESSRWWEQLQQNHESQGMRGHVGQPINYSLMNEVYETERTVSIQSEDRQAEQYRRMHRRAFYCSAIAIFGNVGRVASEEVVLQLINTKCMPSLLYGLEACPLAKSELSSLDFVVNRFFMKMFRMSNIEIVRNCQSYFGFNLPSKLWLNPVKRFDVKYAFCGGSFVNYGNNAT